MLWPCGGGGATWRGPAACVVSPNLFVRPPENIHVSLVGLSVN